MSLDLNWSPLEDNWDDSWLVDPDLNVVWKHREEGLVPVEVDFETGRERRRICVPLPGSQSAFLASSVYEVLYEGTRGPGKTDALLMDFLSGVGRGWGSDWQGILFRKTYPELSDVITKSNKWFPLLCPGAKFNKADHTWTFPGGEQLRLRHMAKPEDYQKYHGHQYPWIGWEELTNWVDDVCYKRMMSCSRSPRPEIPKVIRSTTNPYGPGHNWVKLRWKLPRARGILITDSTDTEGNLELPRIAIHGNIHENKILLAADPHYIQKVRSAARNPSELAAWVHGSWDVTAGGMFDDLWRDDVHIVPRIPLKAIPAGWRVDRSFDWGSSKPFAVLWFAEANGEPLTYNGVTYGKVRGDTYLIMEWYGCKAGVPNEGVKMLAKEVGAGIRDRQQDEAIDKRVKAGPADASIFDEENGNNIAKDMALKGVSWQPADKAPGSRKQGWEMIRKMLNGALPRKDHGPREEPGLFVFDWCTETLRTFPHLSRDDKDLDDVNTDLEDHIADAIRYRIRRKIRGAQQSND